MELYLELLSLVYSSYGKEKKKLDFERPITFHCHLKEKIFWQWAMVLKTQIFESGMT